MRKHLWVVVLLALTMTPGLFRAGSPIAYRFTVPEPQHHWMQVEATFPDLAAAPLELRMSRSSPGRYAIHDFAKNVYDVHASAPDGRELAVDPTDPSGWTRGVARRQRDRPVQDLRRSRRRHVSGDRYDARAHEHARGHHVGARARRSPATLTFEQPPDRPRLDGGDATASGRERRSSSPRRTCST